MPNSPALVYTVHDLLSDAPVLASGQPLFWHGEDHWRRVAENGWRLAVEYPAVDPLVVLMFAVLHDQCRLDEGKDPGHGHRAAERVSDLREAGRLEFLSESQVDVLIAAIHDHNGGDPFPCPVSWEATAGACWDSDRLDLGRVGKYPLPEFLTSGYARHWYPLPDEPGCEFWHRREPLSWSELCTLFASLLASREAVAV